jgi:hypothetical protein
VSSTRLKNPAVRHVLSLDGVTESSAGGDASSDVGDVSVKRSVGGSVGGSSGNLVPVVCAWLARNNLPRGEPAAHSTHRRERKAMAVRSKQQLCVGRGGRKHRWGSQRALRSERLRE